MTTRPLAAVLSAALALGAPLEAVAQNESHTFNQDGKHNKRDDKKAQELASDIVGWADLSPEEQQAVLTYIAIDVHGRRRKAVKALTEEKKGKDLDSDGDNFQVGKKDKNNKPLTIGGFEVVYSEQDDVGTADTETSWAEDIPIKPLDFKDVFKDNSWELKDEAAVRQQIDASFAAFDAVKAKNPKATAKIGSVHITASASTVFNNAFANPADKSTRLTHRQLARARANTIARIVRDELSQRGLLSEKSVAPAGDDFSYADEEETAEQSAAAGRQIFIVSEGANGNGTSGPDSPYNCPIWLVPGAIAPNGAVAKDASDLPAVKEFVGKYCPKGDGPASAQAKQWARLEAEANSRQDSASASSYAKLIENEYEPHRYVTVEFEGTASVSGKDINKGKPGSAHILLVDVRYKPGKSHTGNFKTVKVKRRNNNLWIHRVLCKMHLRDKKKCPLPCSQPGS